MILNRYIILNEIAQIDRLSKRGETHTSGIALRARIEKNVTCAWQRSLSHTPTHARVSTRKGMVRTTPHDHPPPRPQGQRSSLAARSTLRIVCLQFIEDDARLQRSHSRPPLPPAPSAVNSNCIMAGLVADWGGSASPS